MKNLRRAIVQELQKKLTRNARQHGSNEKVNDHSGGLAVTKKPEGKLKNPLKTQPVQGEDCGDGLVK